MKSTTSSWTITCAAAAVWLLVCGVSFAALRGSPDPSRPTDRIDSVRASEIAVEVLRGRPGEPPKSVRVVHAAFVKDIDGRPGTWYILCAVEPAGTFAQSLVVELEGPSGRPSRVRPPASHGPIRWNAWKF